MPIALLARPPQLLNTFGPTLHHRRRVMLQDTAGLSRPTTPSPLTRPMTTRWATSARRSATSSRGSCPRRRSPPCAHAGRRGGHLWRRSPLEDPPLEPPCGTPAGAPPPLEAPNTGLRHPGPMAVSLIAWITTDPRLPIPHPLAHPPTPSGRGSLPCEPFPPPLVPRELRAPLSTTQRLHKPLGSLALIAQPRPVMGHASA